MADGIAAAAGTALVLAGLTVAARSGTGPAGLRSAAAGAGAVLLGAAAGLPALRGLVPPGTVTARRGLPATILARGLLTFAFFGADAYVTLTITVLRGRSTVLAGLALTGATLSWTAGAWAQAGWEPPGKAVTWCGPGWSSSWPASAGWSWSPCLRCPR